MVEAKKYQRAIISACSMSSVIPEHWVSVIFLHGVGLKSIVSMYLARVPMEH